MLIKFTRLSQESKEVVEAVVARKGGSSELEDAAEALPLAAPSEDPRNTEVPSSEDDFSRAVADALFGNGDAEDAMLAAEGSTPLTEKSEFEPQIHDEGKGQEEEEGAPQQAPTPSPRTLARTEAGLQIMAFDESTGSEGIDFSGFDFGGEEGELDDLFDNVFGGGSEGFDLAQDEESPGAPPNEDEKQERDLLALDRGPRASSQGADDQEVEEPVNNSSYAALSAGVGPNLPRHGEPDDAKPSELGPDPEDEDAEPPGMEEELAALLADVSSSVEEAERAPAPASFVDNEDDYDPTVEASLASLLAEEAPPREGEPWAGGAQELSSVAELLESEALEVAAASPMIAPPLPPSVAPVTPSTLQAEGTAVASGFEEGSAHRADLLSQVEGRYQSVEESLIMEVSDVEADEAPEEGAAPSRELLTVLDSLESEVEEEDEGRLGLSLSMEPSAAEEKEASAAREPADDESLESLLAMAKNEIESKREADRAATDHPLDRLGLDDSLPPPPSDSPFSLPTPEDKKKKGGFLGKLFGKD